MMIIFGNIAQMGTVLSQKKVFEKQKRLSYYSSFYYIISAVLIQYPFILLETLCMGTPLFFITKMNNESSENFWIFIAGAFCVGLAGFTMTRLLLMSFNNEFTGMAALIIVIFVMNNLSGFTIRFDDMLEVINLMYKS